ncbi:hypothetical protein [Gaopeijia maritima]|uniref:Uncharacterized protein n=1 Tax=Gaopeijia maritima TaxID=3119007 RepID=A0ABU9E840_9BACT
MSRPLTGLTIALALVALALTPTSARAQALWPVSVEWSYGVLNGMSPSKQSDPRSKGQGSIVVAWRFGNRLAAGPVAALEVSGQGVSGDTACFPGDCLDPHSFGAVSLLVGWESADGRLRGTLGPGVTRAYGDWDNYRLALTARADGAVPLFGRLAFVLFARGHLIPSYQDRAYSFMNFGAGLRLR